MKKATLSLAAAVLCALTSSQALIINDTAFNGTYNSTTGVSSFLLFTPVAGNVYGVSVTLDLAFAFNDALGANPTFINLNNTTPTANRGTGGSWYANSPLYQ